MKRIIAILLAVFLIGAAGTAVVSAARNGTTGSGSGSDYCPAYNVYCPCVSADDIELEVETIDEALEIAKDEIDSDISEDAISQVGRWWIVSYEDEDGVFRQARIDAVTGDVYTSAVSTGFQAGGNSARRSGYCRVYGS